MLLGSLYFQIGLCHSGKDTSIVVAVIIGGEVGVGIALALLLYQPLQWEEDLGLLQ